MVPEVLTASLQVLTPALEALLEPERDGALRALLTACAEILAAVASQPHWQELRPHVVHAVLSVIGASAVSQCPPLELAVVCREPHLVCTSWPTSSLPVSAQGPTGQNDSEGDECLQSRTRACLCKAASAGE